MPGEFDFIEWIKAQQTPSDLVHIPIGDDLAALKWPGDELLLVGADQVIDGVHFDSAVHTPRQIGRKAMNRNLSDCAAMACLPAAAVVTVALPKSVSMEYAKELYLGLKEAADVFRCPIVGGDTSTWNGKLLVSVTIMGRSGGIEPVTRKGARPGHKIYVTGPLGGSISGRHMTFEPRVKLARFLASGNYVTSMIDLSDGLSRDIRHVCAQSGVGAMIGIDALPVHDDAVRLAAAEKTPDLESVRRAFDRALNDGEDYELMFTASRTPDVGILIGEVTVGHEIRGIYQNRVEELTPHGWEHSF